MKRAQTATEYLIIVAVVIIIALIVIGVISGVIPISSGTSESSAKLRLAALDVGMLRYKLDSHSFSLQIKNNNQFLIQIDQIWINNKKCVLNPNKAILRAGQNLDVVCYGVIDNNENTKFNYDFNITYSDVSTNTQYILTPDSKMVGKVAHSSELHTGQRKCYQFNDGLYGETVISCIAFNAGGDAVYDGTAKDFTLFSGNVFKDEYTGLYWTSNISIGGTQEQAESYCDRLDQGGFTDWRLPNIVEFISVIDNENSGQESFSGWISGAYWSSTQDPVNPANYWYIYIDSEYFGTYDQVDSTSYSVVCVRNNMQGIKLTDGLISEKQFVDMGDGIVIDVDTGIVWQKNSSPNMMFWNDSVTYCDSQTTGGFTDWRLPTVIEMSTSIDYSCRDSSLTDCVGDYANSALFTLSTEDNLYWTSTSSFDSLAYLVNMGQGYTGLDFSMVPGGSKSYEYYVRCVRDR